MTCYHPIHGYHISGLGFRTGYPYAAERKGTIFSPLTVPCGQCSGCRQMRSIHWATRCVHEAQLHAHNCFITLTFNDAHLPSDGLDHSIFQLFMKRLRKRFGSGIRFYMCGEYGDNYGRPHFHACIFGFDFSDKKLWSVRDGIPLYISSDLDKLWSDPVSGLSMGFSTIGDVTFESAGYIARYIMKKITGEPAEDHYRGRKPEYNRMSLKPGIGARWYDKYHADVFPHDRVILKGKKLSVPRYYTGLLEKADPYMFDEIKHKRFLSAMNSLDDNTPDRLLVKEACHEAKLKSLVRGVDNAL